MRWSLRVNRRVRMLLEPARRYRPPKTEARYRRAIFTARLCFAKQLIRHRETIVEREEFARGCSCPSFVSTRTGTRAHAATVTRHACTASGSTGIRHIWLEEQSRELRRRRKSARGRGHLRYRHCGLKLSVVRSSFDQKISSIHRELRRNEDRKLTPRRE